MQDWRIKTHRIKEKQPFQESLYAINTLLLDLIIAVENGDIQLDAMKEESNRIYGLIEKYK